MTFDVRTILAFVVVSLFGLDMVLWHVYPPTLDDGQAAIVNQINGALLIVLSTVIGFYFGSSSGSKDKDEALINAAERVNGQTEIATVTVPRQELEAEIKP